MSATGTALVTGARGFLGQRIVSLLRDTGYRVVGLDRVASTDVAGTVCHALELPVDSLDELLAAECPSLIVHAAGPASVAASVADPLGDFEGSVRVLAHVLDATRRVAPGARVIALSSAAVYGNPAALPVAEHASLNPISPYGHHKAMCEALLREYAAVYGMKTCALRIFSAYGAGLRRQLLWDICEKTLGGSVQLFGTGDETRDFIHADDVARAVAAIARGAVFEGEAYNVATGRETTVREVAELVVEALASGTPITFTGEQRGGDPLRWRADVSRLSALGFTPARTFTEGIAEYVAWYRDVTGS